MKSFKKWKVERRSFLVKIALFAIVFYLSLPVSIGLFPKVMSQPRIGWISLAWMYGFAQVGVTWLIGWIYWVQSKKMDKLVIEMKREAEAPE